MFCDKCGNQVEKDSKFCTKCGHQLNVPEEVEPTEYVNEPKTHSEKMAIPFTSQKSKKMALGFVVVVLIAIVGWSVTKPTFEKGLAAYDRKDYATALKIWLPLAEEGNADAQSKLAGMYLNGEGVIADEEQFKHWIVKAAEQGNSEAESALLGYLTLVKDVDLITSLANNGDGNYQFLLGEMYSGGYGVTKDEKQAVDWYTKAAAQGLAGAQNALKRLREQKAEAVQPNLIVTEAGLTFFSPSEKLECSELEGDVECRQFIKNVLPNGYQSCDTSMASGGDFIWGEKYRTVAGDSISFLLRNGREGQLLQLIPSNSQSCDVLNDKWMFGIYGTKSHTSNDEQFISLMIKGDTIYYVLQDSVHLNGSDNQYSYERVVYKITGDGPQEFYKQNSVSKQLIKFEEALPLRPDLTTY